MDIEKTKELKKLIEECIFKMCIEFEDDTGLEIKEINMIEISPCLHYGMTEEEYNEYKSGKRKLTAISLDIRIG